jgi:hypothetical protein
MDSTEMDGMLASEYAGSESDGEVIAPASLWLLLIYFSVSFGAS